MAGRIPEDFIDTLLERVDIVEVIGAQIALRPAGRGEYKALCPFHDEKTASFTVSADKQFYHCFGCGAHGSAIGFLMQHLGLEFPAAIEELAQMVGLQVPQTAGAARPRRNDRLYQALAAAQAWFRRQFAASQPARAYLRERGLELATMEAFEIGYAPDSWQGLADALTREGYTGEELEQAGLVSQRDGRLTDKFRDRVMFPIHDRRGRVIAFGGRSLSERGPKYINSPETPVFHKGRELYRLHQVRRGGGPDQILVVEGYMDAAMLYQYGFENAVATLGTAVTPEHVELMFRTAPVAVFCFDGDRAGRQAAWRGLEASLPALKANREVQFLFLPEGEDPDSLLRQQGAEGFGQLLDRTVPLSNFFFDQLAASVDMSTLDGRARLVALAEPLLEKLPEGPFDELMRRELTRRSGYSGRAESEQASARAEVQRAPSEDRPLTPVQYAVALIVQRPELALEVEPGALSGPAPLRGVDFLQELIDFCRGKPQLSTAMLVEAWRERREGSWLARLATRQIISDPSLMKDALAQTVGRIRRQMVRARIRELQQAQLNEGGLDEQRTLELRELLSRRSQQ